MTALYTIEEMQLKDVEPATAMRLQSWLDTYVNDDLGVSAKWIRQRNKDQRSPEKVASRRERFITSKANGSLAAWIARDQEGTIIGSTTPYIDESGVRHLGSLYVDKKWHGTRVAHDLMQKAMDWFGDDSDVELGVAAYNERAKAFYRKWGFQEVTGSERLFDGKIPEIVMIRKGKK